jgi:hypothetical protein
MLNDHFLTNTGNVFLETKNAKQKKLSVNPDKETIFKRFWNWSKTVCKRLRNAGETERNAKTEHLNVCRTVRYDVITKIKWRCFLSILFLNSWRTWAKRCTFFRTLHLYHIYNSNGSYFMQMVSLQLNISYTFYLRTYISHMYLWINVAGGMEL